MRTVLTENRNGVLHMFIGIDRRPKVGFKGTYRLWWAVDSPGHCCWEDELSGISFEAACLILWLFVGRRQPPVFQVHHLDFLVVWLGCVPQPLCALVSSPYKIRRLIEPHRADVRIKWANKYEVLRTGLAHRLNTCRLVPMITYYVMHYLIL